MFFKKIIFLPLIVHCLEVIAKYFVFIRAALNKDSNHVSAVTIVVHVHNNNILIINKIGARVALLYSVVGVLCLND